MAPERAPLSPLGTIAALGAVVAVQIYLVAPFLRRLRGERVTDLLIEPAEGAEIPRAVAATLDNWRAGLERAGFTSLPLCRAVVPTPGGDMHWYSRVLSHVEGGDVARVMVALPSTRDSRPTALVVLETQLACGGAVRTSNSPLPSMTPPPAGDRVARFPRVQDVARLYALHRAHVRRVGRATRPVRIADPVAFQRREEELGIQRLVGSGYYELAGRALRPTWLGAFLGTWRFLPPWKSVLEAREERLRRELEATLDAA